MYSPTISIQIKFLKCFHLVECHLVLVLLSVVSQGLHWAQDYGLQYICHLWNNSTVLYLVHDLIYKTKTVASCYVLVLLAANPRFHAREILVVWVSSVQTKLCCNECKWNFLKVSFCHGFRYTSDTWVPVFARNELTSHGILFSYFSRRWKNI